ncbi:MAG: Mov34/MPN/PAD-1 family protein [Methanomassiliicoccales archaeon]|nr:MAG: Mov34/MPN/PAD-1 family protein [Methanomassiliicoccales archaeon]
MAKPPKIVGEHKKEFRVIPPPPQDMIVHPVDVSKGTFELYLTKTSKDKILEHCNAFADQKLEVMGFLIGDVLRWKNRFFSLVKDVVSTDLKATNISVRFAKEGFEPLFEELDGLNYDYLIVGWYHSHPGLGCFMSKKDIETQKRTFNKPYHMALVVDPLKTEMKAYKLKDEGYVEKKFAVYLETG